MKSSFCFGIKLKKRVVLHKLKNYLETSKERSKIKIIQNNNNKIKNKKQIKQNSKNKTKENS